MHLFATGMVKSEGEVTLLIEDGKYLFQRSPDVLLVQI